jgi:hypothetical protein
MGPVQFQFAGGFVQVGVIADVVSLEVSFDQL